MKNQEIAAIFKSIAEMLEIKGENPFRIRAYRRAAQLLNDTEDLDRHVEQDTLTTLPGIGNDLAAKIKEYYSTGKVIQLETLKKKVPLGVLELLNIPSLGPKTAKLLYEHFQVKDIAMLEKLARQGKLIEIEGIKEKTVENILKGIALVRKGNERFDIATAWTIAKSFVAHVEKVPGVIAITVAGSLRRMKETVKDIDIIVASTQPAKAMDAFCNFVEVARILARGGTKSSVIAKAGIQVDVRVVEPNSFGAALLYLTGSKQHNIRLRTHAVRQGLKINEYGIFRGKRCLASKTEEDMYRVLKMRYVEPELREDNGEVESALKDALPTLVEPKHIKGDFHVHSVYSDGYNTIQDVARACQQRGYEYVVITDHSKSLRIAGGLSVSQLHKKKKEIDRLNSSMKNFVILFGTEVEIDSDGKIDYDDNILREFDFVIAALHSGFKQSKGQLTKRIVQACQNPHVDCIAHPTGRLWGTREGYDLNFDEVIKVAVDTNTYLEINAFPNRLDLNDSHIRPAQERGCMFAIGTDSHRIEHLDYMKYGVAMARRGWLSKDKILNTKSAYALLKEIKQ